MDGNSSQSATPPDSGRWGSADRISPGVSVPTDLAPDPPRSPRPFAAVRSHLESELEAASELLCCLDFDGTLAPIVDRPDQARITPENDRALRTLSSTESVTTAIVSGRSLADVAPRVDGPSIYAGNHGLELRTNGTETVHPIARTRSELVDEACGLLETVVDPIPNCRVENKRLTGTIHLRGVPESCRAIVAARVRKVVERFGDGALEVSQGKEIIEFSPAIPWGKGNAVELIEEAYTEDAFVIYLGDDRTDESGFRAAESGFRAAESGIRATESGIVRTRNRALPNEGPTKGVGIYVGDEPDEGHPSHASVRVSSPEEVATVLEWIASCVG